MLLNHVATALALCSASSLGGSASMGALHVWLLAATLPVAIWGLSPELAAPSPLSLSDGLSGNASAIDRKLQSSEANLTTYGLSVGGCDCYSKCGTSFDSLIPWCLTSESGVERDDVIEPCGRYSQRRSAYWDECTVNVTSQNHLATTFDGAIFMSTSRFGMKLRHLAILHCRAMGSDGFDIHSIYNFSILFSWHSFSV